MAWQEDLRALDAALAAGRIAPAEHRRRRDELLAGAGHVTQHPTNQHAPNQGPTAQGPTTQRATNQPPPQNQPFPPPFRWQDRGPGEATTGVMPRIGATPPAGPTRTPPGPPADDADVTSVVRRTPPEPTPTPAPDADVTQVVRTSTRPAPSTPAQRSRPGALNLGHDNPSPATGPTRRIAASARTPPSPVDTTQVVRTNRLAGARPSAQADTTQVVRSAALAPSAQWTVTPEQLAASLPPWLADAPAGSTRPRPDPFAGRPASRPTRSRTQLLLAGGGVLLVVVVVVLLVLLL